MGIWPNPQSPNDKIFLNFNCILLINLIINNKI